MTDQTSVPSLKPNFAILIGVATASGLLSVFYLPWPIAAASTLLGVLMVAGADIDARTFLLPNVVTYGAIVSGILTAPLFASWQSSWQSVSNAILRAIVTAIILGSIRKAYVTLRKLEGLGFGDVKLAAAVGAWLPFEAIPICFGLATITGLMSVLIRGGQNNSEDLKLPFGTFLCPSLWLVLFITSLPS